MEKDEENAEPKTEKENMKEINKFHGRGNLS
jgi:hypothetical protein